jgi:hypothetical protein
MAYLSEMYFDHLETYRSSNKNIWNSDETNPDDPQECHSRGIHKNHKIDDLVPDTGKPLSKLICPGIGKLPEASTSQKPRKTEKVT